MRTLSANAPGLFQVWYIRALFIKQQDLILSIEVTAYTSAGRPVRHVAGSGEVYMNFGTAMKISVVTLSAYRSSGSTIQITMRVVSLEEELLDVQKECPLKSVMCTLRLVTAGARWPWLSSRPDQALMVNSGESVQASITCGDRRRRSCCLRIFAWPAIIVETAVGPLLTFSGRCPGESRRGHWHRVS